MSALTNSHKFWRDRIEQLRETLEQKSSTDPRNVLTHFFLQAIDHEFNQELMTWRTTTKELVKMAIERMFELQGTPRQRAASIMRENHTEMLKHIRLADIRNRVVFEIYKSRGATVDTYFDRFSQPPGSAEQNAQYAKMAHGSALYTTARHTQILSDVIIRMELLKRIFIVYDVVFQTAEMPGEGQLNWLTDAWMNRIQSDGLGKLVWDLFLDIWAIERGIP